MHVIDKAKPETESKIQQPLLLQDTALKNYNFFHITSDVGLQKILSSIIIESAMTVIHLISMPESCKKTEKNSTHTNTVTIY